MSPLLKSKMLKIGIHVFHQALRLKHIIKSIDHVIQKVQDGLRGEKGIHMGINN